MEASIINYSDLMGFLHFSFFSQNLRLQTNLKDISNHCQNIATSGWLTLRFPFYRIFTPEVSTVWLRREFCLNSEAWMPWLSSLFENRDVAWCMMCNLRQTGTSTIRPWSHQTSSQVHGWCISNDPFHQPFELDIAKAWKSNYRRVHVAREPANKTRVYQTCQDSAGTWRIISMCLPTHTWSHERRRNLKLYAISHGDNWDQREVNYPTELLLCIPKSLTRYRFGSLSVLFLFPAQAE